MNITFCDVENKYIVVSIDSKCLYIFGDDIQKSDCDDLLIIIKNLLSVENNEECLWTSVKKIINTYYLHYDIVIKNII